MPHQVLQYPHARRPSQLCSITYLRYALFIFTTVLLISSLVLLGFGVWTYVMNMGAALVLPPFYRISVYAVISVGGLVFISGILGCHGTTREKPCLLLTFATVLVVIFLAQVGVGVISYILYTQVRAPTHSRYMKEQFVGQWGKQALVTSAIDQLQMKYKCCGSLYYTEWADSLVIKNSSIKVPDSCCITPAKGCGQLVHPSNIYEEGCIRFIEKDVSLNIVIIPAICLGFSIMQVFGIVFSCALARQVSKNKKIVRKKYIYYS